MPSPEDRIGKTSRRKKIAFRLVLVAAGLIAGLIAAEIGLRVIGFSEPQIYVPDEQIGTRLMPGFQGVWTREGQSRFQINKTGFRDLDREKSKPKDTYRIAVLGDSYVEALQVPREKSLPAVLQTLLNDCPERPHTNVEVLSFGVSGFGTAQELLTLRHFVWDYEPDLVLLVFCPDNDIADNHRALAGNEVRPFFVLDDDRLALDDSFREHPLFVHANRSTTRLKVDLINRLRLLQLYARFRRHSPAANHAESNDAADRDQVENLAYLPPIKDEWREAWEITQRLLVQMAREVEQSSARFVLVMGTTGIQVDPRDSLREDFRKQLGVDDFYDLDRRIQRLADEKKFSVIRLAPDMLEYARDEDVFLHGFSNTKKGRGHWNVEGHRVAAGIIAEDLCRRFAESEDQQ